MEESNTSKKRNPRTGSFKGRKTSNLHEYQNQNRQVLQYSSHNGFDYQNQYIRYYPVFLPLPPPIPLHLALPPPPPPPHPPPPQNQSFWKNTQLQKSYCKLDAPPSMAAPDTHLPIVKISPGEMGRLGERKMEVITAAKRPDSGGVEGSVISLLANHFLVRFDPFQKIFHYNVEISPNPSKEICRLIKQKLVEENSDLLSGASPAYDGRKNLYSPVEFNKDRLDFYVNLPIPTTKMLISKEESNNVHSNNPKQLKMFRINIRLVSKLEGKELSEHLSKNGEKWVPLPQDYLHALDVVLRESSVEKSIQVGRSLYSKSMWGCEEIGGGAVGLRGFFQSLRPTQQGLAMNVDCSVTAFHESIGVIPYLQKRLHFLRSISKTTDLSPEERREIERTLKNIRIFVCHRETVQKYRVSGLTEETTENLRFPDRNGKSLRLVNYFKDHYDYEIQFLNLPCLQISRSKLCYLPMELCVICEGQKFLGKLSDDQTARILKMGCQKPKERKAVIDGIMQAPSGPASGGREFKLQVSTEMTRLKGRILQPPKLKLGDGGNIRELIPSRHDRQWNLFDCHVFEGTRIERWGLISFGGTPDQKSNIPKFIHQLSKRSEELGIFLTKNTVVCPQFEPTKVLNNVTVLESKLKKIHRLASRNLQLLICVMERKHKGYADLKRIAETNIGVVSQCCLYPNLSKLSSQFLANLALKINAKVGGCTVSLFNPLPSQIPRLFGSNEPVIFMGADVTHPHPLDDFSPSVAAVVGSMNWPAANKYISRMRSQTHRQEIILDLAKMVEELLEEFCQSVHEFPRRIIFFRDGVSETQFYKVLKEELQAIKKACSRFPNYKPPITFAVVQKRHHTRLFPFKIDPFLNQNQCFDENIPPGTVVDTVITHPKEFDFFLCSHWGMKGTSRPTHYHVLWDENEFTSDELQKLVHNLCYTYAKCTKPVSLVPPAYYAHLAAYRGRLYLTQSDTNSTISRAAPPKTTPLPELSENVKKLMFYC